MIDETISDAAKQAASAVQSRLSVHSYTKEYFMDVVAHEVQRAIDAATASLFAELESEQQMIRKQGELISGLQKVAHATDDDSPIASCNCITKTPDIQYHLKGCKYRLIVERDTALAQRDSERRGYIPIGAKLGLSDIDTTPYLIEVAIGNLQDKLAALQETHSTLLVALDSNRKERDDLKRQLAEKNETANTFMAQVKKLQASLHTIATYDEEPIWDDDRDDAADGMLAVARKALGIET